MNISVPVETEGRFPSDLKRAAALPVTLLVVSESEQPHIAVRNTLTRLNWTLYSAFSCEQAEEMLREHEFGVVLCDCDFSRGNWKGLLEETQGRERPPRLVLFCRHADVALWGEVLNLGAWDLLMYPFEMQEVGRSAALAWESWAREGRRNNGAVTRRAQALATDSSSAVGTVQTRAPQKAARF